MEGFAFRPLTDDDLALVVQWRRQPHVLQWFDHPVADIDAARQRFGRRIAGDDPVRMWVAELDGRPIGYLQDFAVEAFPDLAVRAQDPAAVAFDYLIGEPDLVGRGIGTAMIDAFCRQVLVPRHPGAPRFLASPDVRNHRSIRALEKCGFTQGLWIQPEAASHAEVVCTADRELFDSATSVARPLDDR